MMKWLVPGTGAALLVAGQALAMVPPRIQQRNQLKAIIDLPALADFFPIERIERIAPDLWRVNAGRCHVDVRMVPRQRTGRGLLPPRIEPVAGRRVCRR